jgi:protein SCO1/2
MTLSIMFLLQSNIFKKEPVLPMLGNVSDFVLYDTTGQEFQRSQLNNKIWVAGFFFTTCGNICPIMIKNMGMLSDKFKNTDDVRFVSITVNPEFDSPEVLAEYAKKNNADDKKWYFLTGSRESITELAVKSFKIGSKEEPIFHSAYFVLVDRAQKIRGYYEGTQKEAMEKLSKDTSELVKEK